MNQFDRFNPFEILVFSSSSWFCPPAKPPLWRAFGQDQRQEARHTATQSAQSILSRRDSSTDGEKTGNHVQEYINTRPKRKPVKRPSSGSQETADRAPAQSISGRAGQSCALMLIFNLRFYEVFNVRFCPVLSASMLSFVKVCQVLARAAITSF